LYAALEGRTSPLSLTRLAHVASFGSVAPTGSVVNFVPDPVELPPPGFDAGAAQPTRTTNATKSALGRIRDTIGTSPLRLRWVT
jgi:hypothetical protein